MCERTRRFYQRFFGETPSQKTPDTCITSIRVAKLGNAYTGQPPPRKSVIYAALGLPPRGLGLPPPGGTPSISLIPPRRMWSWTTARAGRRAIVTQGVSFWGHHDRGEAPEILIGAPLIDGDAIAVRVRAASFQIVGAPVWWWPTMSAAHGKARPMRKT